MKITLDMHEDDLKLLRAMLVTTFYRRADCRRIADVAAEQLDAQLYPQPEHKPKQ